MTSDYGTDCKQKSKGCERIVKVRDSQISAEQLQNNDQPTHRKCEPSTVREESAAVGQNRVE
jgi:hypothetical protein